MSERWSSEASEHRIGFCECRSLICRIAKPMASEIKLQALKENVDTVEVNAVKVSAGDVVAKDQPMLEVQADKAALEVPSPMAGRIAKILVKVGDQIKVGQVYCVIERQRRGGSRAGGEGRNRRAASCRAGAARQERDTRSRAPGRDSAAAAQAATAGHRTPLAGAAAGRGTHRAGRPGHAPPGPRAGRRSAPGARQRPAWPRRRGGRQGLRPPTRFRAASWPALAGRWDRRCRPPPLPNFEEWGPVETQPLGAVRKATARQMSLAWSLIPHVTQHDLADITDLEAFRKQQSEGKGPKLTVTAFVLRGVARSR